MDNSGEKPPSKRRDYAERIPAITASRKDLREPIGITAYAA
jgi:hypothetical protein